MIDEKTKKDFLIAKNKIKHPYKIHLEDWGGKTSGITVLTKIDENLLKERNETYYSIEGTFINPNWAVLEVEKRLKIKSLLSKIEKSDDQSDINSLLKTL